MIIKNRYLLRALLVLLIPLTIGVNDVYSQQKLTRKERKLQDREAKADRLFIEGQKFLMLEEYEKAYFYFGKALEYKPESGAINYKIAEILARANQADEALKYGQKAVEADPDNKYYHLLIAEVYNKQQKPEQAAEVLNSLMENSDENQQYILELASLYLASKDFDNALDALDRAEEYYGIVPQITFQKQKIYLQKNDLESAITEGLNLIEASPGHSQYVLALVEILFNNGKTDHALEVILHSLSTYPNQPDLQLAMYSLYKNKSDIKTAEEYLREAFSHPDLAGEVKAKAYSDILRETNSQRKNSLLGDLEGLMIEHHPDDPSVHTVLGDKALFANDKTTALGHYQKALELNPANEAVLQGTISLMFELAENFEDIEKYTTIAVEEFPNKAEFWFFDGTSKLAQKKHIEAEPALSKALALNKGSNKQLDILATGQLGDTFYSMEKKEEAYKAYEKVLELSPENEHALNNYAYFLSLDKKDLDKAKKMSEKLVIRFPTNSTYLDTHAWVLFQSKDYENALKYMKKALEHQTSPSGVLYEHYGDILFKLGDKKEALVYWKKAEELEDVSELLGRKIKDKEYYD